MEDWPLVQLMEGDSGGVVLRNLSVYEVTTEEDALQLFFVVCLLTTYIHTIQINHFCDMVDVQLFAGEYQPHHHFHQYEQHVISIPRYIYDRVGNGR